MSEWYLHMRNPSFPLHHEFAIFKDGTPVMMVNTMPEQEQTLHEIVELIQVANDYADERLPLDILAATVKRLFSHE